jgi:CheY-like chemotaxis protein
MTTILVVDDEPVIRELLVQVLRDEGYATVTAGDGVAALESLESGDIDLVLTDTMMPRLDGVALIRTMRKRPVLNTMPVVLLSAAGRPALDGMGDCVFLPKPFDLTSLLAAVADAVAILASHQSEGEASR